VAGIWARRFTVAHDCGLIINPDGLEKCIEGNIVQGISRTLWEEVTFDNNAVTSVDAGESFTHEIIRDHIRLRVDRRASPMDRRRSLGIPPGPLLSHILQPYRFANRLDQHRSVHRAIVRVVTPVGARPGCPDHPDLVLRHAQDGGEARLHEVRLLRAAPAGNHPLLDLDQSAGRSHGGVRLKRPFILGLVTAP
jgi:hypothetical protein